MGAPCPLLSFKEFEPAVEEAKRHLDIGREHIQRGALVQARSAFRRAAQAVPDKMLVDQDGSALQRYAAIERSSLLNEALCCQRLAEAAEGKTATGHWEDALRACSTLLDRHEKIEAQETSKKVAESAKAVARSLLQKASANDLEQFVAKAHFRRALAYDNLHYLADAIADLEVTLKLLPGDAEVLKRLDLVRRRQQKAELRPAKMF